MPLNEIKFRMNPAAKEKLFNLTFANLVNWSLSHTKHKCATAPQYDCADNFFPHQMESQNPRTLAFIVAACALHTHLRIALPAFTVKLAGKIIALEA